MLAQTLKNMHDIYKEKDMSAENLIAEKTVVPQYFEPLTLAGNGLSNVTYLDDYRALHHRLDDAGVHRLVERAQNGDEEAARLLCINSMPLARRIAFNNKGPGFMTIEQKTQTGIIEVPKVARRYNSSKGAKFKTLLTTRMVGALADEDRREDELSRRDRDILEDLVEIEDIEERSRELQALVTNKQEPFIMAPYLIDEVGVKQPTRSLDALMSKRAESDGTSNNLEPVARNDIFEEVVSHEESELIKNALKYLTGRQQQVTALNFGFFGNKGLTQREIAEILAVTESRVCQIQRTAYKKLRRVLEGEENGLETNRLESVEQQIPGESEAQSRQRAYSILGKAELKHARLLDSEINSTLKSLPDWRFSKVKVGEQSYHLLLRKLPKRALEKATEIDDSENESRRLIGKKDSSLTILVQDIEGRDLQLAIDIERQFAVSNRRPVSKELANQLGKIDLHTIGNLYIPPGVIAHRLSMKENSYRARIDSAKNNVGSRNWRELVVTSYKNGLLSLEKIPIGQTDYLTSEEIEFVQVHCLMTASESLDREDLTRSGLDQRWHRIYSKTGAKNRVQLILMAIKDGLIDVDDLVNSPTEVAKV
jgi:RNA polymerase sigma factor for flagellar operon FliA